MPCNAMQAVAAMEALPPRHGSSMDGVISEGPGRERHRFRDHGRGVEERDPSGGILYPRLHCIRLYPKKVDIVAFGLAPARAISNPAAACCRRAEKNGRISRRAIFTPDSISTCYHDIVAILSRGGLAVKSQPSTFGMHAARQDRSLGR